MEINLHLFFKYNILLYNFSSLKNLYENKIKIIETNKIKKYLFLIIIEYNNYVDELNNYQGQ